MVGIVSEVDAMRKTEKKEEEGLFVTTVYMEIVELRLAIYGWGGNGAQELGQLHSGMLVEFATLYVCNQKSDEKQKRGDFEYMCFFSARRGSSFRILRTGKPLIS